MMLSEAKYCTECGSELSSYRQAMDWTKCNNCDY